METTAWGHGEWAVGELLNRVGGDPRPGEEVCEELPREIPALFDRLIGKTWSDRLQQAVHDQPMGLPDRALRILAVLLDEVRFPVSDAVLGTVISGERPWLEELGCPYRTRDELEALRDRFAVAISYFILAWIRAEQEGRDRPAAERIPQPLLEDGLILDSLGVGPHQRALYTRAPIGEVLGHLRDWVLERRATLSDRR